MSNFASKLAQEILDMEREIIMLRDENYRLGEYEKKYHDLLDSSLSLTMLR